VHPLVAADRAAFRDRTAADILVSTSRCCLKPAVMRRWTRWPACRSRSRNKNAG
jgi:hypothetical protein